MKKLYKIKKSKIDNRGLYAAKNIKKDTKIIEYKGKIISVKETEANPKFDNNKAIYLFNLNKKYFVYHYHDEHRSLLLQLFVIYIFQLNNWHLQPHY